MQRLDGGKAGVYHHFAYRFLSVPPSDITAVSDELPLVITQHGGGRSLTARGAFVCGLFVAGVGVVTILYGSSDITSRVLLLQMHELDDMFNGHDTS